MTESASAADRRREALAVLGERVRHATADRDRLIVAAAAAELSQREIARAVGLSHTAVQAIIRRAGEAGR